MPNTSLPWLIFNAGEGIITGGLNQFTKFKHFAHIKHIKLSVSTQREAQGMGDSMTNPLQSVCLVHDKEIN